MLPPALVNAAPTPVPGGANQLNGVSGGLSSALFNGKMRIRQMQLRPATAAEASPAAGQPGVPARGMIAFVLDSGFTPVKILLTDGNGPAFRINLKPTDLPAKPAP